MTLSELKQQILEEFEKAVEPEYRKIVIDVKHENYREEYLVEVLTGIAFNALQQALEQKDEEMLKENEETVKIQLIRTQVKNIQTRISILLNQEIDEDHPLTLGKLLYSLETLNQQINMLSRYLDLEDI
jgi:hypothetical protein